MMIEWADRFQKIVAERFSNEGPDRAWKRLDQEAAVEILREIENETALDIARNGWPCDKGGPRHSSPCVCAFDRT